MRKHLAGTKGFSMVELVFAVAVIATALILFIGVFFSMFRATEKGVDLTAGTVVAESQIMNFLTNVKNHNVSPYDTKYPNGLASLATDGSIVEEGTVPINNTVFTYQIQSWEVDTVNAPNLRKVEITVWWWGVGKTSTENGGGGYDISEVKDGSGNLIEHKTGYGRLKVVLSRLVYTMQ